ncbi:MAG: PspC domain-containing protein [Propionibacterium sp.]|nr:PspC domain-containing protein [Propionibacterium sp.]
MDDLWGLQRSVTDAKVAGVCAALADRWRIDPLVVRMATVIAMLSAGVGVVLYTAAAVMLPREGEEHSPLERSFPDARQWSKRNLAVAMLIAAAAFAVIIGSMFPLSVMPTLVIAAAWYFGYQLPKQRAVNADAPAALPAGGPPRTTGHAPSSPQPQFFPHYRTAAGPTSGPPLLPPRAPQQATPPPLPVEPVQPVAANPTEDAAAPDAAPPVADEQERTLAEIVAEMEQQATPDDVPHAGPSDTPEEERTLADIVAEMEQQAASAPAVTVQAAPDTPAPADTGSPTARPEPDRPPSFDDAAFTDPLAFDRPSPAGMAPAGSAATVSREPHRSPAAQRLRWIVPALMLLAVGGLGIATAAGVAVAPALWVAVPAAVAAAGLVVSGFIGRRPRGLMAITIITTLIAVGIGSSQYLAGFTEFERFDEPLVLTELPADDISSTVDDLDLDLTGLDLTEDARLAVRSDLGDISVTLPEHITVVVHADSRLGNLSNEETDETITEIPASATWEFPADRPDAPTLTLDLSSEVGDVEVER